MKVSRRPQTLALLCVEDSLFLTPNLKNTLNNKTTDEVLKIHFFIAYKCFYRYLKHLAKLVDAYHIFNSDAIRDEDFEIGSRLLHEFVDEFEKLYGPCNMVRMYCKYNRLNVLAIILRSLFSLLLDLVSILL